MGWLVKWRLISRPPWVKGCPLPATMCQIDHADGWADGGPTDLANLGPACQFHNRDRYRRPERYQRHRTGKDRWTYTYLSHTDRARVSSVIKGP
ncbi:MAG: hypothetical protein JWQ95_4125 [Sphaerisporangium sp.]|nr:hypothetical protein [Sphaerisporangium sp.]